ncbi:MAG: beta-lactamase family protein [Alphaproteobacteria bacterium]|nr:beta-lactamase family protein [Alphaproteobacteria bacterium]
MSAWLRRLWPGTILLTTACALAPQVATADPPIVTIETNKGKLADAVNRALLTAASPEFGGALIIEQNGKTILKSGYGYADRERRIPFRAGTIAQIGSISKSFTAAAIADLESRGKVNAQALASTYLPELNGKAAGAVTIRQLLTHTAGYPEYCGDDFERSSVAKLLRECLAPLDAKTGAYAYSNAGYSALALVVERTSGVSLEAYLRDRITGPLGMRDTGYLFPGLPAGRFAKGSLKGSDQGVISDRIAALDGEYWNLKGNGGIQATSNDMIVWGRALFGAQPDSPAIAGKLSDRRNWATADQAKVYYGYGVHIALRADGSVERISHTGSDGVFFSLFRWYPEEKILLYFVGNSGEDDVRAALLPALSALRAAVPIRE